MTQIRTTRVRKGEQGFTLIEMMIAAAVLIVGVMAMAGLVGVAISGNGHNRLDSTATMLCQAVTEQVYSGLTNVAFGGSGVATLSDCAGNTFNIDTTPPALASQQSALTNGVIDFSQPKIAGYHMDYVICSGNVKTTYDVRWNITHLGSSNSYTNLLTVGVQMEGGANKIINFPINMKVMLGPDPAPGS